MDRNIIVFDSSSATFSGFVNAIATNVDSDGQFWELIDHVSDSAFVIRCVQTGATFALRVGGQSGLEYRYDPDGEMIDATTLDASQYATNIVTNAEIVSESVVGTRVTWVGFRDAFYVGLDRENSARTCLSVHAGFIVNPDNKNDPEIGITGEGVLFGYPQWSGTNTSDAWTSTRPQQGSCLRYGPNSWYVGVVTRTTSSGLSGAVGARLRLAPSVLSARNSPVIGATRYVRTPHESFLPKTIYQDANPNSDFAWMGVHDNSGTSSNGVFIPWRKGVTP